MTPSSLFPCGLRLIRISSDICLINHENTIPYHTKCLLWPKDHFKARKMSQENTENCPNPGKLFTVIFFEGFPKEYEFPECIYTFES